MPTIGFLGAGKMGGAILVSLKNAKVATKLYACDAYQPRLDELKKKYKVHPATALEVIEKCDVVFLAVKPQDLEALLKSVAESESLARPLYISIAAGRKLEWLEALLPKAAVVRAMPNLAVSVGEGMTGYAIGSKVKKNQAALAGKLLALTGKAVQLKEEQLDAVTALSVSGPAFMAYVLQAMIDGGVALGLENEVAQTLAIQTMLGTATVLQASDGTISDFIKAVTSAKGTTAEGLAVLEKSAVKSTMKRTLAAAARRSKELSKI